MSDIDIFDPLGFFAQRVKDLEQEMIAKQARSEILKVNRSNLEQTLRMLGTLPEEQQKALQMEVSALQEALVGTQRTLDTLHFELDSLGAKLSALRSAARTLSGDAGPAAEAAAPGGGDERPQPGPTPGPTSSENQAG